tara:strand:+ start:1539 stop:1892 length:354 start_codon:yes stop_codon:yes gene_type:complete
MNNTENYLEKNCSHQTKALTESDLRNNLEIYNKWQIVNEKLFRKFNFNDFHQTIFFVNSIVNLIHNEDHHPILEVGYNFCNIKYNTHSVNNGTGGISENDFICAAKIDLIFQNLNLD